MAKKTPDADFNMSEAIRAILTDNPKLGSKEVSDVILTKYPTAKINKNSFSVAFYTGRKKLGISSSGRARKSTKRGPTSAAPRSTVDLALLQATARFLSEVGGADAALEAIKQVQAIQVK
jgi:hypothetical protein